MSSCRVNQIRVENLFDFPTAICWSLAVVFWGIVALSVHSMYVNILEGFVQAPKPIPMLTLCLFLADTRGGLLRPGILPTRALRAPRYKLQRH